MKTQLKNLWLVAKPTVNLGIPLGLALVLLLSLSGQTFAQGFNLEAYLKQKDTNKNGRVEPEELSNNARGIIRKMGFDDKKSNSISRIVAKSNKAKKAMVEKSKPSNSRERKTQGFGVEKSKSEGVSRFGATSGTKSKGSAKTTYSKSVVERVASTLARYDKDKDGSLSRREVSSARWGSPPPEQNDTNKDGRLSKDELSVRYASREQVFSRSRSSTPVASRSKSSKSDNDRSRRAKARESFRKSGASSVRNSSRSSGSTSTRSGSKSSSTDASAQAKYERYANSLVKQYDTDKDGKLSSEETKKMRRPPAGADANKDGVITKDELIGSLSGENKKAGGKESKSDSKQAAKSSTKSKYSRDRGGKRGTRNSSTGTSSSFDKLDANTDKQIQMHEFSEKWSEELVQEFYEKDANGDGVITIREWSGKK